VKALFLGALAIACAGNTAAQTLDIYFIDVEGGQSTLVVTPQREALLIDTGFAAGGTFESIPGDPKVARDANRILSATRDAGVEQIDYLLITHFHPDHDGGVTELAQLIPIRTFIDHGSVPAEAESVVVGTTAAFAAYAAVRAKGRHIEPKPGDLLPVRGIEAIVVSSAASPIAEALAGAGEDNAACGPSGLAAADPIENPRSTAILIQFGAFRFLDVGDLSGQPLLALVCPQDLIGPVDAYLVAHHGGADAAEPATFAALEPRIAIMNNSATKGGALEMYEYLHRVQGLEDVWQLHRSEAAGEANFAEDRIANLDESTAHWVKLSANEDGSFRVLNGRTGEWTSYRAR
jgi:competence protein ComEC